ncbi:MAG: geranylgeranyl reductase family protein [Burkholderiaceae bacterium]|nr:MAG: geranylgeranyl reductase family protein [Burkholderiaceae bacterium]
MSVETPTSVPPFHCQVLVIGAGPAGCAAARVLAAAGQQVLLVEQHALGRDKTCGDGLIPDAHHALMRLGLHGQVMARAQRAPHVACVGPRGGRLEVPGELAVLPRRELDEMLARHAIEAGATCWEHTRFERPLEDGEGRVCGAVLQRGGQTVHVHADWVILATGAVPKALMAAGMCERHTPSGVGLRGYVHAPGLTGQIRGLEVVWADAVRPGYGWIFPAPDGHFNIGVGVSDSHAIEGGKGRKKAVNLRAIFDAFCEHHPAAAQLMKEGTLVGELKGAPLRWTLEGARWSRPGLLVAGEAVGSTYSFTGEGIGKAMETGILAAESVLGEATDAAVRERYEAGLSALKPKYALYEKANRINAYPWVVDLVIWRARRSQGLVRRLAGILDESRLPDHLFSWRGIKRIILG